MKNSNIILNINDSGYRITATLIHIPRKKKYAVKAVMRSPKPQIMQTLWIEDYLYPGHIDEIKQIIIDDMKSTYETLLTK